MSLAQQPSVRDIIAEAQKVCASALGDSVISVGRINGINDFLLRLEDESDIDLAIKFVNIAIQLSKDAQIIAVKAAQDSLIISEREEHFNMGYKYYVYIDYEIGDLKFQIDRIIELVESHASAADIASFSSDFETTKREAIAASLAAQEACELSRKCCEKLAVSLIGESFNDSLSGKPIIEDTQTFYGYIISVKDYISYHDTCDISTARIIANNIIKIVGKIKVDVEAIHEMAFKIVNHDDGFGIRPLNYCIESAEDTKTCAEEAIEKISSAIENATFVLESDETTYITIVVENLVLSINAMIEANKLINECGLLVCSSATILDFSL